MKFIATTSDKINWPFATAIELIFSTDDRVIYLDSDKRTSFEQIITLIDDTQRLNLVSPINGFYFVDSTKILWRYSNAIWTQLTNLPDENIIFIDEGDLPVTGKAKTLYVTEDSIYQWSDTQNNYINMNENTNLEWTFIE